MKSKKSIKNIIIMAILSVISLFFINMSLAANTAKISVETANLREEANENSKILELLSLNEEVEVIEKTGDWYKVKARGITGYLRNDLISLKEEVVETTSNTNNENQQSTENEQNVETSENKPVEENNTDNKEIQLGKYKIAETTKLKIVPSINATNTIEVKIDEEVEVIEIINGWVCVETQTTKGWLRKDKIKTQEEPVQEEQKVEEQQPEEPVNIVIKTLFVNSTTVNLRKEANTSAEIVTTLPVNTAVDVLEESNGWSKVRVSGKEGYISSSLLSETKQETSRSIETSRKVADAQSTQNTSVSSSGDTSSVVSKAKSYIGSSYVYGGSSPSGFDCSGFTSYVYKQFGVNLSRTAAGQYNNGTSIDRGSLQAGDLVMFGSSASNINHVGIYIGGGQIVHAANKSRGVTIDTINSGYYNNNYVGARRVM